MARPPNNGPHSTTLTGRAWASNPTVKSGWPRNACPLHIHRCFPLCLTDKLHPWIRPSINQSITQSTQLHNTRRVALALLQRFSSFATILVVVRAYQVVRAQTLAMMSSDTSCTRAPNSAVLEWHCTGWYWLGGGGKLIMWVVEQDTHYAIVLNSWIPGDVVVCNRATHTTVLDICNGKWRFPSHTPNTAALMVFGPQIRWMTSPGK
jgi:hypothetical protein